MAETINTYRLPLPDDARIHRVVGEDGPGHPGQYKTALDFAIDAGMEVLAPLDGEVITVVDVHDKYGNTPGFAQYANYVQIKHEYGEISDLIHLEKDSVVVKVGEKVKTGQLIGRTGLSGFITAPHLHWFVFKRDDSEDGFSGLMIQTTE